LNLLQQNCSEGKLHSPAKEDAGSLEWKFEMVELFKAKKITEARKLLCGKLQADEMVHVYRWLYDNLELFGDEKTQDRAIFIIKAGLVDHTSCIDPEINLSATLAKLANL